MTIKPLVILSAAVVSLASPPGWGKDSAPLEPPGQSESKEKSAADVLDRMARHSGYRLELIGELPPPPLQLSQRNASCSVDLLSRIRTVLDKVGTPGYVLITDKSEKTLRIIITRFANDFPAPVNPARKARNQSHFESPEYLRALHRKQDESFRVLIDGPEFRDMVGMKNAERWAMHAKQWNEHSRTENDPNTISEPDGMTNGELWQMHEEQYYGIQGHGGRADLDRESKAWAQATLEMQHAQMVELNTNPEAIDPLIGITNSELSDLHERQYEQLHGTR